MTRSNPSDGSGSTVAGAGTGVKARASTSCSCRLRALSSTPQVARMRRDCGSSVIASNRCSSPTVSCRCSVARRKERWIVSSVSGEKGTRLLLTVLLGFHRHQQRKLVFLGCLAGRLELGFGDVMGIDAGKPLSGSMHAHHDRERFGPLFVEYRLENPDHELLRGVVVVVQQDFPETGPFQLLGAERFGERRFLGIGPWTHSGSIVRSDGGSARAFRPAVPGGRGIRIARAPAPALGRRRGPPRPGIQGAKS